MRYWFDCNYELPVGIVRLGRPFVRTGTEKAHALAKDVLQRRALERPGD